VIDFFDKTQAASRINKLWENQEPFIFLINFDQTKSIVLPLDQIPGDQLQFEIGHVNNLGLRNDPEKKLQFSKKPISYTEFRKGYDQVQRNIQYGNSFLTNLTFETPIDVNWSMHEIFIKSKARFKIWLKNEFVCFSPEKFIHLENGKISSYPMKGTIDATLLDAEEKILKDKKEIAEHVTIVDLIRNDLSMVADQVDVPAFRYTELIHTNQADLIQVSSKINGIVKAEYQNQLGDLIFKLLPAGSISGAPKTRTIDIIENAECHDRGFYTGVCGVFDGKELNSGVMIRYIANRNGKLYFKSGGGITHFSDSKKEYQEYIDKIYMPV